MIQERIFVTGPSIADEAAALLKERGCLCGFGTGIETSAELAEKLAAFRPDALIVRKGVVTRAVLDAAPTIRAISKHGVGVDCIDVEAATSRGIPVMVTPQANFESVAEHTLALMLALVRQVPVQDRQVRGGVWKKEDYEGDELLFKTLGLIGYGRIARRLAELVQPFRMEVLAFDPYSEPVPPVRAAATLEELLSRADIVSIHCPLTPETKGMIGRDEFRRMKPGAYIVNTARGAVIDEDALIDVLREGRITAAGLDTLEREPPVPDNPLLRMDNVLVTSHVGAFSRNSFRNMGIGAVRNVLAVLSGQMPDPDCLINPEVFDRGLSR